MSTVWITYWPCLCVLKALHTQPALTGSGLFPVSVPHHAHPAPVWHQTYRHATALTWPFVFWPPWHMERAGTAQMSTKCWWRQWGMDGLGLRGCFTSRLAGVTVLTYLNCTEEGHGENVNKSMSKHEFPFSFCPGASLSIYPPSVYVCAG